MINGTGPDLRRALVRAIVDAESSASIGPADLVLAALREDAEIARRLALVGVTHDALSERLIRGRPDLQPAPDGSWAELDLDLRRLLQAAVTAASGSGREATLWDVLRVMRGDPQTCDRIGLSMPQLDQIVRDPPPQVPDGPGRAGGPVEVRLGDRLVGDLGHPQVDRQVLRAILDREGKIAVRLRERGIDEGALDRWP